MRLSVYAAGVGSALEHRIGVRHVLRDASAAVNVEVSHNHLRMRMPATGGVDIMLHNVAVLRSKLQRHVVLKPCEFEHVLEY